MDEVRSHRDKVGFWQDHLTLPYNSDHSRNRGLSTDTPTEQPHKVKPKEVHSSQQWSRGNTEGLVCLTSY